LTNFTKQLEKLEDKSKKSSLKKFFYNNVTRRFAILQPSKCFIIIATKTMQVC